MTAESMPSVPRTLTQRLYGPFPPAINPHREVVRRHMVEWGQRFGLFTSAAAPQLLAARLDEFSARIYPQAAHDVLQLAACWFIWLFVRDD